MTEPMMITKEMRESREKAVSKIVERVNADIQKAAEQGRHECYFSCSKIHTAMHRFTKRSENGLKAVDTELSRQDLSEEYGSSQKTSNGRRKRDGR